MNLVLILVGLSTVNLSLAAGTPTAAAVIEKVDHVRNPSDSYFMAVEVTSPDGKQSASKFDVSLQGNAKTLIKTVEPARDRGRNLLMLNEEMWAYIPNLKRAVRVNLSQKLTGQAANGDISRMRWSGDYSPVFETSTPGQWTVLLTANKKGLTYEKIRVWVDQKNYHPLKAEFLTPAGKVLKKAAYKNYQTLLGAQRPTEIWVEDAVHENDRSIIHILSMEERHFSASTFNQNSLE